MKDIHTTIKTVLRGEIWMADLGDDNIKGSEQKGKRPVLIIQNDVGNKFSTTTIVACITTKLKTKIPTHMNCELYEPSTIMFEQLKTISKDRLNNKIGKLNNKQIEEVKKKLMISIGF